MKIILNKQTISKLKRAIPYAGGNMKIINFQTVNGTLVMSATDSYRLYRYNLCACSEEVDVSYTKKSISDAVKVMSGKDTLIIDTDTDMIRGAVSGAERLFRPDQYHSKYPRLDGFAFSRKPEHQVSLAAINSDDTRKFKAESRDLESKYMLGIKIENSELWIGACGDDDREVPSYKKNFYSYTNGNTEIGINAHFLTEALKVSKLMWYTDGASIMAFGLGTRETVYIMPMIIRGCY